MEKERFMINSENSALLIVDIQEKLANTMKKSVLESMLQNVRKLIELAKTVSIPILITEQYPKGLGITLSQVKEHVDSEVIEKIHFSCLGEEKFVEKLKSTGRNKIIITGMETHVCVYQTCLDLLLRDYHVFVPKDAVCSRRKEDWKTGVELMRDAGAVITCTETLIFQILRRAGTAEFKRMLEFVK